ncbi:MAG: type II restriction endonuclease [Prevotellaceae bacterium]|nr:type II restriction endonuclease [Prevotellaceae bacterium]
MNLRWGFKDFSWTSPTNAQIKELVIFLIESGLADILKNRQIKNLVDYTIGVEVGLDSNGRKNRSRTMTEQTEIELKDLKVDKIKVLPIYQTENLSKIQYFERFS